MYILENKPISAYRDNIRSPAGTTEHVSEPLPQHVFLIANPCLCIIWQKQPIVSIKACVLKYTISCVLLQERLPPHGVGMYHIFHSPSLHGLYGRISTEVCFL